MRIQVAIVVIGLSASAFAVERLPGSGLYAKYARDQNVAAQAAQDRFYERSERIAAAAISSICTGCLGLRHHRMSASDRIDTTLLVAPSPAAGARPRATISPAANRRVAMSTQRETLPPETRKLLLSRLIIED